MSESILKALMSLFAIIANVDKDGVSAQSRSIVESYLKLQLSQVQVDEYLAIFDEYILKYHGDPEKNGKKERKKLASNSVKVLRICEQINEELQQDQKILVMLQLLEFISYGEEISDMEMDFVKTVSDVFNIPEDEFFNAYAFTLESSFEKIPYKENILILDANDEAPLAGCKHHKFNHLRGYILILYIPSIKMYAFRYVGEVDLYLNGHIILLNRTYMLPKGSAIRSPRIGSIYYSDIASQFIELADAQQIVFTAKDVEFRFKGSSNGIHRFNFSEKGGELIGIMGGSGVGKSTLLNVLNGNLKPQSGQITINGYDIYDEEAMPDGVIGFVPQDDLLIEELTVYQNLYYNAKLCFRDLDDEDIDKQVMSVLEDLDLVATKDLIVGNPLKKTISGGQRKRLNIALELIREPQVLFVDEPTSGLSSMDSEMVMDLLKEQTLKGKLVIINIHQPSSEIFKMFDKLLIMDKGGYLVYYGNPVDSVVYFKTMSNHVNALEAECFNCGNINPEQVLSILESKIVDEYGRVTRKRKISPEEWAAKYQKNLEPKKVLDTEVKEKPKSSFSIPTAFSQFKVFMIRNILSKLANTQYMLINFLEAPLLAMILAYFTKYMHGTPDDPGAYIFTANENIPIYLFMAVVVAIFVGLTVSAEEIIRDRQLLKREKFLNLSRFSYLNSKVIILFVISAIQTLTFIAVGNWILEVRGMLPAHWLILFSASCAANMIGLNISAALDSVITIYILIPFLIVPQLLFSGTMVKFDKLNTFVESQEEVPMLGDMMLSRWAYEAMAVKQFRDNVYEKQFFYLEKKKSEANYIASFWIPALNSKISKILYGKTAHRDKHIQILYKEVAKLDALEPSVQFPKMDQISPEAFDEKVAKELQVYLDKLASYYQRRQNKAIELIDEEISRLKEEYGREHLVELKSAYKNDFLSDLVTNRQEISKIHETAEGYMQLTDPIYKDPVNRWGRAHFYAASKRLGNLEIDTYWFNIGILWLYSLVLYVLLITDGLRKLLHLFAFRKKS